MSAMLGVYNIIAVLPCGAALCLGLFLIYGVSLPGLVDKAKSINDLGGGFSDLGLLVLGAFVAGELVHAAARICERYWWFLFGDWPSVKLIRQALEPGAEHKQSRFWVRLKRHLYSDQLTELSPDQRKRLRNAIERQGIAIPSEQKRLHGKQIVAVQREMFVLVRNAKRDERVFAFNQNYGFFSGLQMTFLVLAPLAEHHGDMWLAALYLSCFALSALGTFTTAYDYGGELVLQFLRLDDDKPETAAPAEAARVAVVIENKTVEIGR